MRHFVSHKRVEAGQIVTASPGEEDGVVLLKGGEQVSVPAKIFARGVPSAGDYLVRYADGYLSFSPKAAFEDGYREVAARDAMTFGAAIEALRDGGRVAREGWNGKGMFLFLVPGSRFTVNRAPLLGIYPEGTVIDYHAHIDMKTAQGYVVPWLASQADMLATDWVEVAA